VLAMASYNDNLTKISALMSVAGIFIIAYAIYTTEPVYMNITSLTEKDIGKIYYLPGSVESIFIKNKTAFIKMSDSEIEINVIMFTDSLDKNPIVYELSRHENVTVYGKIQMYKGDMEIIAYRIKKIENH
jgi:tRNA(Ile2) C34 agmatinyltransferase TiaS